jgi:hypothetical protein
MCFGGNLKILQKAISNYQCAINNFQSRRDEIIITHENLESIQNGTDTMNTFLLLTTDNYTPDEIEEKRKQLLEYCKLDTLAMVRIFQKLKDCI